MVMRNAASLTETAAIAAVGQERGTQSSQGGPASGGWGVAAQAASAVLKLGLAHGTCSGPVSHGPQL